MATGQADYEDPAAFSRHEAFDQIFEEVHRHRYGHIRAKLVAQFYAEAQGLKDKEFPQAIADIMRRPGWGRQAAGWIASVWAERDPQAAWAWLMRAPGRGLNFEHAILAPWGRTDPAGMFDWVEAHQAEFPSTRKDAICGALCALGAELDPERGLRLMATLSPNRQANIFFLWARQSPAAAGERVLAEPDAGVQQTAIPFVAFQWVQHDHDATAALAWAEKISDPALNQKALFSIGNAWFLEHSAEAADLLARLPQSNEVRQNLGMQVVGWWKRDWDAAARWALQVPDEGLGKWLLSTFPSEDASAKMAKLIESLPAESREAATRRWAGAAPGTVNPSSPTR